jgi:hypothetical protein
MKAARWRFSSMLPLNEAVRLGEGAFLQRLSALAGRSSARQAHIRRSQSKAIPTLFSPSMTLTKSAPKCWRELPRRRVLSLTTYNGANPQTGLRLPNRSRAKIRKPPVIRRQRQLLDLCLRGQQPVERVAVFGCEQSRAGRVTGRN